jgi:hypothetical protein
LILPNLSLTKPMRGLPMPWDTKISWERISTGYMKWLVVRG